MSTIENKSAEGVAARRRLTARKAISPREFSAQTGISEASTLRAIHRGEVRAMKIGKRFLIPIGEPDRILAGD